MAWLGVKAKVDGIVRATGKNHGMVRVTKNLYGKVKGCGKKSWQVDVAKCQSYDHRSV